MGFWKDMRNFVILFLGLCVFSVIISVIITVLFVAINVAVAITIAVLIVVVLGLLINTIMNIGKKGKKIKRKKIGLLSYGGRI